MSDCSPQNFYFMRYCEVYYCTSFYKGLDCIMSGLYLAHSRRSAMTAKRLSIKAPKKISCEKTIMTELSEKRALEELLREDIARELKAAWTAQRSLARLAWVEFEQPATTTGRTTKETVVDRKRPEFLPPGQGKKTNESPESSNWKHDSLPKEQQKRKQQRETDSESSSAGSPQHKKLRLGDTYALNEKPHAMILPRPASKKEHHYERPHFSQRYSCLTYGGKRFASGQTPKCD